MEINLDLSPKDLRKLVDAGKKELGEGIVVVFANKDEKVGLAVGVTENLTNKYDAVKFAKLGSEIIGGKGGGGRKDFAQACAKSLRPPPPFPPIISDPSFANLTASYLFVKFSVTPTARPTFSSLFANTTTIPSPNSFLPASTSFLRSFGDKSRFISKRPKKTC